MPMRLPRRWLHLPFTRTQLRVEWLEHKVRALEGEVAALLREAYKRDQETNDLMGIAYQQGKDDARTLTPEEAREKFPGYGEDVA